MTNNDIFEANITIVIEANGIRTLSQIVKSLDLILTNNIDKAFNSGSENPIYSMVADITKVVKL